MINEIKLSKHGRAYISLHMKPYGKERLTAVEYKLDTGADLTTVSKETLSAVLGYTKEWIAEHTVQDMTRTVSRAGGKAEPACYVVIPTSNILGRELSNWPFYIRAEEDNDFPNLLGINILSYFNFSFSYDKGFLNIEPAVAPVIKLPMLVSQEIGELKRTI